MIDIMEHSDIGYRTATNIIVPGRGLEGSPENPSLTMGAQQRVRTTQEYLRMREHAFQRVGGVVVFSGAYPGDRMSEAPDEDHREGSLMLQYAHDLGMTEEFPRVKFEREIQAVTTLENMLQTREQGFFAGTDFTPTSPLGIVCHGERGKKGELRGHAARAEYFGRKAFYLGKTSIESILVVEEDDYEAALDEDKLLTITRVAFLGARRKLALRRREKALTVLNNTLRKGKREIQNGEAAA